ncbi:hypothetical protein PR048_012890 [Dryococelus australis]|uniref:Uncharacterized protein n=1 Tax=Dryococelus australis TaxID=614101 RepID=A0ABQ9HQL8_9NEOP|nr:hypothetical protein PR048_012890 [Dryococelus australis]
MYYTKIPHCRAHSFIERKKKQALKAALYLYRARLQQLHKLLKPQGNHTKYSKLILQLYLIGMLWNQVKVFEVRKNAPEIIFYKTSYEEEEMKEILVPQSRSRGCQ